MSEYTEGVCEDGAAILKDGVPMTISEILSELSRSPGGSTVDARRIAADILGEYAVLSHDGSFLNGEHYWVDAHELEKLIQSSIDSR